MSQVRWTYVAPSKAVYRVGIYHGDTSGHVLIYVNTRILNIDFSILKSKMYSFLLEEQLCEVRIKKEDEGKYSYEFTVNEEILTPAAIEHRRLEKRHLIYSILFLLGFVLLIILVTIFLR